MGVKVPKLRRRPRVVDAEDCPTCGMPIGQKCKSYKGRGCAPHAVAMARFIDSLEPVIKEEPMTQGELWP